MIVAANEEYIQGRRRLRRLTFWGGTILFALAILTNFAAPQFVYISWPLLIFGFLSLNLSRQAQFELGLTEPTEKRMARTLGALSNRYWLGCYVPTGREMIDFLLVGPEGVLVLLPKNHTGATTYAKGRWRRRTGFFSRLFGVEPGIGDPGRELEHAVGLARQDLQEAGLGEAPVAGAVVFTAPYASLSLEDSPVTALTGRQLEAWAASRRAAPEDVIGEPLRRAVTEHFAARLSPSPVAPPRAA